MRQVYKDNEVTHGIKKGQQVYANRARHVLRPTTVLIIEMILPWKRKKKHAKSAVWEARWPDERYERHA